MKYYLQVLRNYFEFSGRARRKEYWMYTLFNFIFAMLSMIIDNVLGTTLKGQTPGLFYSAYALTVLIPGLSVGVIRMHDVGKSGWFLLIPVYNLILACTNGDAGDNEYGADPKAIDV